jgi:murein DD-endopeptidase
MRAVSIAACTALWFFIGFGMWAFARERGPRVEVVCPSPPQPVRIGKQQVLVYELHITNFDSVPLKLTRIEVFGNEPNGTAIRTLTESSLAAAMTLVGSRTGDPNASKDTQRIEPGGRGVVFLWVELPLDQKPPATLRHKMVFAAGADGGTAAATLEDFPVPVSRDSAPTLSPPFNGGTWVAGDGPANNSPHRRSIFAIDGHIYSPERFAIDWVKVGPNGDSHHDGTKTNENWWGFGEPVLAVADGEITEVVDGIADNTPRSSPPVTLDNIAGNHVILQISPTRFVTYAHLQNGSIKVRLHDKVLRGAVVALLGNSGNTTGAHLHFQVTDGNSVLQSEGVPFTFSSFNYLGPGADYEIDKHVTVPWESSIPPGDAVIEFRSANK